MFLVVVQIPTLVTGHMSYVDIGWPAGLCVMAYHILMYAEGGNDWRRWLVGGALMLHGGRMFATSRRGASWKNTKTKKKTWTLPDATLRVRIDDGGSKKKEARVLL